MGEVTKFYPKDAAQDPDVVLERAIGRYADVLVIGYDRDGELNARASLTLQHKDILWLVETFKQKLLAGEFQDE